MKALALLLLAPATALASPISSLTFDWWDINDLELEITRYIPGEDGEYQSVSVARSPRADPQTGEFISTASGELGGASAYFYGESEVIRRRESAWIFALEIELSVVASAYVPMGATGVQASAFSAPAGPDFYFTLTQESLYTGSFLVDGRLGSGSILAPGNYYVSSPSLNVDTGTLHEGESAYLSRSRRYTFQVHAVPEPGVIVLLGSGLLGLALSRRRRNELHRCAP